MRYKVILSYDGAAFSGWQVQKNAASIQESLEKGLSVLLGGDISVTGAGRTDAGVNAISYVAHFDAEPDLDTVHLGYKLNAILPSGIVVHDIQETDEEFHARFSAVSRSYMYFVNRKRDPFAERFSYRVGYPIDIERMNAAAERLLGTRDFSCFEKTGGNNKTSICTITFARWETYVPDHVRMAGYPAGDGDYLVFRITADRFLRNMVRAIVGTLIDIGRGRHPVEWIDEVLESGDRCMAGDSVPGKALFLSEVKYF